MRKWSRKVYKLHVVKVVGIILNENPKSVRDHPVLKEFMDVFPEEIPILPLKEK